MAKNVVILGDLNAGGSYITIKGWQMLRLRTDPKFHWVIGDEEDTTVRAKTQCAYDRSVQDDCTRSPPPPHPTLALIL